jgi:hypothetical protein
MASRQRQKSCSTMLTTIPMEQVWHVGPACCEGYGAPQVPGAVEVHVFRKGSMVRRHWTWIARPCEAEGTRAGRG